MKKGLCVYPGSFDPVTNGHLDLIERGATLFPEVIVAILHNPAKQGHFSIPQRLEMLRRACAHLPNVSFDCFDGLLVDYMRKVRAGIVLRGLRAVTDFESEFQMAQVNHQICPDVETLFLMTSPQHAYLSSSVVREVGMFGGDISSFVPACIAEDVRRAFPVSPTSN
ncbi:MAG: pantetheine-phosphate adenylyltransferase [Clostridia bacterium]